MTKLSPMLEMLTILVQGNSMRPPMVSTHWYTLSDPKKLSTAGLFVNGRIKARQACNNRGGSNQWITAGSSIALPLKKGDEVYIRNVHVSLPTHLMGPWTAFGGVLIN